MHGDEREWRKKLANESQEQIRVNLESYQFCFFFFVCQLRDNFAHKSSNYISMFLSRENSLALDGWRGSMTEPNPVTQAATTVMESMEYESSVLWTAAWNASMQINCRNGWWLDVVIVGDLEINALLLSRENVASTNRMVHFSHIYHCDAFAAAKDINLERRYSVNYSFKWNRRISLHVYIIRWHTWHNLMHAVHTN